MRILSILFLLVVFMASIASAEVLTTANPLGQGVFAFEIAGMQDSNFLNQSDATLTSYGGYIAYGLLDKLDLFVDVGSLSSSKYAILGTTLDITGTAYGAALKYAILDEADDAPVSVGLAVRYRTSSQKMEVGGVSLGETNYAQTTIGVGVSKIMVPFIPYLSIAYRDTKGAGNDFATQTDITIGSAIAWSKQGAVFVEYTSQSIQDKSGAGNDHTSPQIALGVAYALR